MLVPGALALTLTTSAGGGQPTKLSLEVPPLRFAAVRAPLGDPTPPPPPLPGAVPAVDVAPPPPSPVSTPVRLLAEAGGTAALGFVGGLAGGYAGARTCTSARLFGCMGNMAIGMSIGGVLGAAGGATLAGDAADGDGNFFVSLLGAALGFAAGVALESEEVVLIGTAAGSIGGYELSHALAD